MDLWLYFADTLPETNPYTSDGKYGDNWVALTLYEGDGLTVGTNIVYGAVLGKQCKDWKSQKERLGRCRSFSENGGWNMHLRMHERYRKTRTCRVFRWDWNYVGVLTGNSLKSKNFTVTRSERAESPGDVDSVVSPCVELRNRPLGTSVISPCEKWRNRSLRTVSVGLLSDTRAVGCLSGTISSFALRGTAKPHQNSPAWCPPLWVLGLKYCPQNRGT